MRRTAATDGSQPESPDGPRVAPEDDEYSMSDQSLGDASAMSPEELGKLFEVKKVEKFAADDPNNPKNIRPNHKHQEG
jgi:DNA polymerase-3 subunit gamma/tau